MILKTSPLLVCRGLLLTGLMVLAVCMFAPGFCAADAPPARTQEPKKPYPYKTEEVVIQNPVAGISLAGTLSLPPGEGPFPAVLLITGSGPQNRDEEILGHRPFLVLSDQLARRGIVVLRMDDRGVGGSTGEFATALNSDFADDVRHAVEYLKTRREIAPGRIGLLGHSSGGTVAVMAAQKVEIGFLVLLASPALKGIDFAAQRDRFMLEFAGIKLPEPRLQATTRRWQEINNLLVSGAPTDAARQRITPLMQQELAELTPPERALFEGLGMEMNAETIVGDLLSPWNRDNMRYDPRADLQKITGPVLALYGDKDIFVPAMANGKALEAALKGSGHANLTIRLLRNTNHFFQTCQSGMPFETYMMAETIAPNVLKGIGEWILTHSQPRAAGEAE